MNRLNDVFALALFVLLGWALANIPPTPPGLTGAALRGLAESGVENPVTAALLNYRGYDTLLEVAVFLLTIVGVWSLRGAEGAAPERERASLPSLLRMILPMLLVAAGYLLWIGSFAPGGAFQAGALIGGAGVLAWLGGRGATVLSHESWLRLGLSLGLITFALVTAGTLVATGNLLGYPPGSAGTLIFIIELAAMVSIALTLAALFIGGRPQPAPAPRP